MRHVPVLLNETIESLQLKSGSSVIDCTLGDAGHAEEILKRTAPDGKLFGIDADPEAILRAGKYLHEFGERVKLIRSNFINLKQIIDTEKFGPVRGILLDLGWSSPQFEERGRGFSFQKDEPLNMRYDGNHGITAADILNKEEQKELERIFRDYGEEKFGRKIAKAISKYRKRVKIENTGQLVNIILSVYRKKLGSDKEVPWIGGTHPATKVFQALRIAVNDELNVLELALPQAVEALAPGGRLAVISFHSLEDRIVKHYFKSQEGRTINIITKKPIECSEEEYKNNPRARSAKMRVVERI
ncbi:MAG: 16S rRNA (cytosine(1402)-N(4))-methyltransferase RsmH [Patescibacteria group bacterium]